MNWLNLIFPKFCINCGKYGSYVCLQCLQLIIRHKQICIVCNRNSPLGKTHHHCQDQTYLDGIIITTEYKSSIKKTLHKIKYGFSYAILEELLTRTALSQKIRQCLEEEKIHYCTDIPLYNTKLRHRGFNQSILIARWLASHYQLTYKPMLQKIKATTPQMQLNRMDRLFNLDNAFTLNPKLSHQDIRGQNYIICDDITTTGTTLEECAKVLKKAGAQKVWAFVIASGR